MCTLFLSSLLDLNRLGREKRLEDLQRIIEGMEDHDILLGYGNLGKQTLKEIVLHQQELDELKTLKLWWDQNDQVLVSQNFLIVGRNEENIESIAGQHPLTGKLGFIKEKVPTIKGGLYIPVVIGDIRLGAVQNIANLSKPRW